MAYTNLKDLFVGICDAIREKKGTTGEINHQDIPSEIADIQSGTDTTLPTSSAATSSDILSPKQAWVNGEKVTGNIQTKTSSDIAVAGATITVPAGYYGEQASKSIANGSLGTPSISVSSGGVITATSGISTSGYIGSGSSASNTYSLTTQAGKTVTPSTSTQTAVSSGRYTTGTVYVGAIPSDYVKPTSKQSGGSYILGIDDDAVTFPAGTYLTSALTIQPAFVNVMVKAVSGAAYDFYDIGGISYSLGRPDAWTSMFESTNAGKNSSYSLCRVTIECNTDVEVKIVWYNGGEKGYDYGIIGKLNTALSLSYNKDSVYEDITDDYGSTSSSSSTYTVRGTTYFDVPSGGGWFDIKYRKDSSGNYGTDAFAFYIEVRKA